MQPATARQRRACLALDLILPTANAASGCSLVDEVVSGLDSVSRDQIIVLFAKMRLCSMRVVPGSIPVEPAARAIYEPKQIIDLINGVGRRRSLCRPRA
jgi:hypothetical protein